MYKIVNVSRDNRYKGRRTATPGRESKSKVYRFGGRRLVPTQSMLISDDIYKVGKEKLQLDESKGKIKVIYLPRKIESTAILGSTSPDVLPEVLSVDEFDFPLPVDVTQKEELSAFIFEARPCLKDTYEALEEDEKLVFPDVEQPSRSDEVPSDEILAGLMDDELVSLAEMLGILGKAKARATILRRLRDYRDKD